MEKPEPITNARSVNLTIDFDNYHISYNPSSAGYGCVTTAIVLKQTVFLVLNGDHKTNLEHLAKELGLQGCIKYFANNIDKASKLSEHLMATGLAEDLFSLAPTTLTTIGETSVELIRDAVANQAIINT